MKDDKRKMMLALLGLAFVLVLGYQGYKMTQAPSGATTWKTAKNSAATAKAGTQKTGAVRQATGGAGTPITFQEVEIDIDRLLEDIEVVNFDYQTQHIQRDPMTPLAGQIRPQTGMAGVAAPNRVEVLNKKVTGIIQDPVSPAAVVDDEVVSIGYVYPDGTTVQDIERDRVVFRIGDSLIPVEMQKAGMRQ